MRLERLLLGTRESIAGNVYGTIVVLATLTAGATAYEHELWELAAIAATTVLILWIAHVYAHGLGESLHRGRRLTMDEVAAIAGREVEIPVAAVLPISAVILGALGVFRDATALWIAVGIGVAILTIQGVRYARLERLSRIGAIIAISVNVALGLSIVALKVIVTH